MPEVSGSDIEKGCILERPKVIYNAKTKKYVMGLSQKYKMYIIARRSDEIICCYSSRLPSVKSLTLSCFTIACNDEAK